MFFVGKGVFEEGPPALVSIKYLKLTVLKWLENTM
jgi:hypothetical protein